MQHSAFIKKQDYDGGDYYRVEEGEDFRNCMLYEFLSSNMSRSDGATLWLLVTDDQIDRMIGGNTCFVARCGNIVCIKSSFSEDETEEEGDVFMPTKSARKLLVQMERLLVEMPERAEIIWHEDGSATLEWQPTSIRHVAVQRIKDRYSIIDQPDVQKSDQLLIEFLNTFLDLIRAGDQATIAWLYNPMSESINIGSLTVLNKIFNWVEGSIVVQDQKVAVNSVALKPDYFRLMCEHAMRISNEKPSQIVLKWYKQGVAFEWERDCDVASK